MFKDLSLKGRILLLALLPSSLLATLLGAYFTAMQLYSLKGQLNERSALLATHLAPLAATALSRNDEAALTRIAKRTLEHSDVRSVAFIDAQRRIVTHAGPSMLNAQPDNHVGLSQLSEHDATRLLLPIYDHLEANTNPEQPQLLGWVDLEVSHQGTLLNGYRILFTSLLIILTGLLVITLFALRMSRSINTPLSAIKAGVNQIKDGHLETRLPHLSSHELDELAAGINRMAESLQNAQDELQQSIEQATEDVRQNLETIEVQNIELDLARKEALEASRIKSEFLANMSHEIRTPLNGILGFTNLLEKSELSPRQQDYLGTIKKSADSLLGIINEILDFSKIEAGKLVLEVIPFNLRELLQDTLTILAPAAHEKKLELVSLIYRDTPLSLTGDPQRLKQVLTNLLSNAIKFTDSGTIAIRAMVIDETPDNVQLRISVSDTGVGLSEEDLHSLFQAFNQADNSLSRQAGGTGLGLVISKHLIEQMGGEIGVDSTPEQGSQFWISLTLAKARHHDDELPHHFAQNSCIAVLENHELARQALLHQLEDYNLAIEVFDDFEALLQRVAAPSTEAPPINLAILGLSAQQISPEQLGQHIRALERAHCKSLVLCPTTDLGLFHSQLPDAYTQLQAKPACARKIYRALSNLLEQPPATAPDLEPDTQHTPHILCVDDNPANLLLVQTLLEDMGANVCTAENGYSAFERYQHDTFDLVLMDIQMPGMDGKQSTQAIRQWEQNNNRPNTPIVALTAHALANEKRLLLQSGMDDYLTKPISEHQLAQVVLKWTGLALNLKRSKPAAALEPVEAAPLKVLDHDEGLRLAAGKPDLAADMLHMLISCLPSDRQTIEQARLSGDRNALIERVHRLHGATRYCGVPQLRAACHNSESLLKQDDSRAEQALDELNAAIDRLIEQYCPA